MDNKPTQRRFAVMGENTFKIASRLVGNQDLCRLLKYQVRDPLDKEKYENVDGIDLINKQILVIPKVFDDSTEKMSYLISVFEDFVVNSFNSEFKLTTLRFDIACPYDEWMLDDTTLRPYRIMQLVDDMFNEKPLAGIGTLQFHRADILALSPWIGGYTLRYNINEFN